jgi:hypothetical protein
MLPTALSDVVMLGFKCPLFLVEPRRQTLGSDAVRSGGKSFDFGFVDVVTLLTDVVFFATWPFVSGLSLPNHALLA